jgi:hypothetical protein
MPVEIIIETLIFNERYNKELGLSYGENMF